ncbi:4-amino-4-deoxy-L-arabinose transferase-like glycosyltransferase [Rubricella aquisinus]|uniref:4-amino-4-deoxy-L-arabinose transferase-like glycosyltransferase n=1 Tax=Rubricella aquisinus TaxID=2028108 RepID=A0A840WL71_9RHOB|nr:glycosyltransferase family 39 protein [Rubricella aquisinus]MBB5515848.1 4-amino-4-deoxy-L-arabinose transferase-like glycosyltransferase [Rubricella aquisinus]
MLMWLHRFDETVAGLIARLSARPLYAYALVALIATIVLLPGLAQLPVTDRDEGRYVLASKQMMESGDYIDIRNQDEPRWKKPVGIYWLQVVAAKITGFAEAAPIWVYRLPSFLGIVAASLLTIWAVRPLTGPPGALIAGIVVASAVVSLGEGSIAKTDAALLATCVAMQGALLRAWRSEERQFDRTRALFWIALALGVLIKGPIILLLALGTLGWLCWVERDFDPVRQVMPWPGIALFAVIAAPWFIAIGIVSDGAFYLASVGDDLLGKVGDSSNNHGGPYGYYLMTVWITFWPWAVLALLALPFAWANRDSDAVHFLFGWVVPFWLVFAVTTTKLPHYILPILPAFGALIGLWITSEAPKRRPVLQGVAALLFLIGGGAVAALVAGGGFLLDGRLDPLGLVLGGVGAALILAAAMALILRAIYGFGALALAAALILLPSITAVTLASPKLDLSGQIAGGYARYAACTTQPLHTIGYREPSLVFLAGTETTFMAFTDAHLIASAPEGTLFALDTARAGSLMDLETAAGVPMVVLGTYDGINYNRGGETRVLLLARADDATLAACRD